MRSERLEVLNRVEHRHHHDRHTCSTTTPTYCCNNELFLTLGTCTIHFDIYFLVQVAEDDVNEHEAGDQWRHPKALLSHPVPHLAVAQSLLWVAVKELNSSYYVGVTILCRIIYPFWGLNLSYYIGETLLFTIYIYIYPKWKLNLSTLQTTQSSKLAGEWVMDCTMSCLMKTPYP